MEPVVRRGGAGDDTPMPHALHAESADPSPCPELTLSPPTAEAELVPQQQVARTGGESVDCACSEPAGTVRSIVVPPLALGRAGIAHRSTLLAAAREHHAKQPGDATPATLESFVGSSSSSDASTGRIV